MSTSSISEGIKVKKGSKVVQSSAGAGTPGGDQSPAVVINTTTKKTTVPLVVPFAFSVGNFRGEQLWMTKKFQKIHLGLLEMFDFAKHNVFETFQSKFTHIDEQTFDLISKVWPSTFEEVPKSYSPEKPRSLAAFKRFGFTGLIVIADDKLNSDKVYNIDADEWTLLDSVPWPDLSTNCLPNSAEIAPHVQALFMALQAVECFRLRVKKFIALGKVFFDTLIINVKQIPPTTFSIFLARCLFAREKFFQMVSALCNRSWVEQIERSEERHYDVSLVKWNKPEIKSVLVTANHIVNILENDNAATTEETKLLEAFRIGKKLSYAEEPLRHAEVAFNRAYDDLINATCDENIILGVSQSSQRGYDFGPRLQALQAPLQAMVSSAGLAASGGGGLGSEAAGRAGALPRANTDTSLPPSGFGVGATYTTQTRPVSIPVYSYGGPKSEFDATVKAFAAVKTLLIPASLQHGNNSILCWIDAPSKEIFFGYMGTLAVTPGTGINNDCLGPKEEPQSMYSWPESRLLPHLTKALFNTAYQKSKEEELRSHQSLLETATFLCSGKLLSLATSAQWGNFCMDINKVLALRNQLTQDKSVIEAWSMSDKKR